MRSKPFKLWLTRVICGALRSAIHAHGPIDKDSVPSAAKRVAGTVMAAIEDRKTASRP